MYMHMAVSYYYVHVQWNFYIVDTIGSHLTVLIVEWSII